MIRQPYVGKRRTAEERLRANGRYAVRHADSGDRCITLEERIAERCCAVGDDHIGCRRIVGNDGIAVPCEVRRNDFLRSKDSLTDGAVAAFGQAGFAVGRGNCCVRFGRMPKRRNDFLRREGFAADRAVAALGQAGIDAVRRCGSVDFCRMPECRHGFSRRQHGQADRAADFLGEAGVYAVGRDSRCADIFGVSERGNGFRCGQHSLADRAADFLRMAFLRTGRGKRLKRHGFGMPERGDFIRELKLLAAGFAEDVIHHARFCAGGFDARDGDFGVPQRRKIGEHQLCGIHLRLRDRLFRHFGILARFFTEGHRSGVLRIARVHAVGRFDLLRGDRHFRRLHVAAGGAGEGCGAGGTVVGPCKDRLAVAVTGGWGDDLLNQRHIADGTAFAFGCAVDHAGDVDSRQDFLIVGLDVGGDALRSSKFRCIAAFVAGDGQRSGTVSKSFRVNICYSGGNGGFRQPRPCKGFIADGFCARRDADRGERAGTEERAIIDGFERRRECDVAECGAVIKCVCGDDREPFRKIDRSQAAAILKSIFVKEIKAVGQCDRSQFLTAVKGILSKLLQCGRKRNRNEVFHSVETMLADAGDSAANHNGRDVVYIGIPGGISVTGKIRDRPAAADNQRVAIGNIPLCIVAAAAADIIGHMPRGIKVHAVLGDL